MIVAVPVDTPFTTPLAEPMVAMVRLPLVHVPPSGLANVVVLPTHAVIVPVIAGVGFTVIVLVAVLVNPLPSVMVTVYTDVAATDPDATGEAETEAPVVADRPVAGDQE